MPRSRATWRAEWPSTVTSRTASALNSSVNARRTLAIHHLRSDHTELAEVSARAVLPHVVWKGAEYASSQHHSGQYRYILGIHAAESQEPSSASTQSAGEPPWRTPQQARY